MIETGLVSEAGRIEMQVAETPQRRSFKDFSTSTSGISTPALDFRRSLEASSGSTSAKATFPLLGKEESKLAGENLRSGPAVSSHANLLSASTSNHWSTQSPTKALSLGADVIQGSTSDLKSSPIEDVESCVQITSAAPKPHAQGNQASPEGVALAVLHNPGKTRSREIRKSLPEHIVGIIIAAIPTPILQSSDALSPNPSTMRTKLESDDAGGADNLGTLPGWGTKKLVSTVEDSVKAKKLERETKMLAPAIADAVPAHSNDVEQLAVTPIHVKSADKGEVPEDKRATLSGHGTLESIGVGVSVPAHTLPPSITMPYERANRVGTSGTGAPEASGAQPTELKTLVATPHVLEIGVGDGTRGWLRVRAEIGRTGEISASVIATSAEAAERLHTELPALSAYLEREQFGIVSLVVNATNSGAGALDAGMSFGTGTGSSTHSESRSESSSIQDREVKEKNSIAFAIEDGKPVASRGGSSSATLASIYAIGSGGWLSIRV